MPSRQVHSDASLRAHALLLRYQRTRVGARAVCVQRLTHSRHIDDVVYTLKADTTEYLSEDIDLFSWNLTASEMAQLTAATTPASNPSWSCSV